MNKTLTTTMTSFKVGTAVKWTSGAGGYNKTKKGTVVGVIAKGKKPPTKKFPTLRANGTGRNSTSFIIEAGGKFYWPHVSLLKKA